MMVYGKGEEKTGKTGKEEIAEEIGKTTSKTTSKATRITPATRIVLP